MVIVCEMNVTLLRKVTFQETTLCVVSGRDGSRVLGGSQRPLADGCVYCTE